MSTATPRTDALAQEMSPVPIDECFSPMMNLARSLERDLQECVELLRESVAAFDVEANMRGDQRWDIARRIDAFLARRKERIG